MATLVFSLAFWFFSSIAIASDLEDARRLIQTQNWSDALPILRKLNESEPKSKIIAHDLAHVLLKANRREEAIAVLKKAEMTKAAQVAGETFLSKASLKLHRQGQNLLESGSLSQACDSFEKAHEKDSAHFEILLRYAQCEILDGNPELGIKAIDSIERIHGENAQVRLWKARALFLKGSKEASLPLFEAAYGELKSSENAALWYAEALFSDGKKAQAHSLIENHCRLYPLHLRVLILGITERALSGPSLSDATVQELKKEIQVVESRLIQLKAKPVLKTEERLGVELTNAGALEKVLQELTQKIENRKTQPAS